MQDAADLTEAQREQLGVRKALLYASLRPVLEIRRAALQALQVHLAYFMTAAVPYDQLYYIV